MSTTASGGRAPAHWRVLAAGILLSLVALLPAAAYAKRITLHTIGLGTSADPAASAQLQAISDAAKGSFHDANNLPQLSATMQAAATGAAPGRTIVITGEERVLPQAVVPPPERSWIYPLLAGGGLTILVLAGAAAFLLLRPRAAAAPPLALLVDATGARPLRTAVVIVGRDPTCGVPVPYLSVSRSHAKIWRDKKGDWHVTDLGSANGTTVNGARISAPMELRSGDMVSFGEWTAQFELASTSSIRGRER